MNESNDQEFVDKRPSHEAFVEKALSLLRKPEPPRIHPDRPVHTNEQIEAAMRECYAGATQTAKVPDPFARTAGSTATIHPAEVLFTDPPFLIRNGSRRSIFVDTRPTKNGTEMSLHTGASTFTIMCPDALNIEVHPDGNITLRVSNQEKA